MDCIETNKKLEIYLRWILFVLSVLALIGLVMSGLFFYNKYGIFFYPIHVSAEILLYNVFVGGLFIATCGLLICVICLQYVLSLVNSIQENNSKIVIQCVTIIIQLFAMFLLILLSLIVKTPNIRKFFLYIAFIAIITAQLLECYLKKTQKQKEYYSFTGSIFGTIVSIIGFLLQVFFTKNTEGDLTALDKYIYIDFEKIKTSNTFEIVLCHQNKNNSNNNDDDEKIHLDNLIHVAFWMQLNVLHKNTKLVSGEVVILLGLIIQKFFVSFLDLI